MKIAISLVFGVGFIALLSIWMLTRVRYVTIVQGADSKAFSAVVQELQQLNIPHKVIGSSIRVPEGDVNRARIQLAEAGLPKTASIRSNSNDTK